MGRGITVTGLDELIRKFEAAGKRPEGLVKRALYEGAGVMADAIKASVQSIPVDEKFGTENNPRNGVTAAEKTGLINGVGISHMREENGSVSVVIGFAGVNAEGEKNTTVMRRVESGTSRTRKHPTVRPAKNRTKTAAIAAMQQQFEKDMTEEFQ